MARTVRILSIHEFKQVLGVSKIQIRQSKRGNYYATDETGLRVASVSEDAVQAYKESKPLVVLELEDFGESWFLITKAADNSDNSIGEL